MDWLGKRLYRGAPRHERRKKLGALIASIVVGVVIAVALGLVFYWIDVRRAH